jgi:hypothetical protein
LLLNTTILLLLFGRTHLEAFARERPGDKISSVPWPKKY